MEVVIGLDLIVRRVTGQERPHVELRRIALDLFNGRNVVTTNRGVTFS